ncbi:PDZ and LIM domain protein Zasp isoform X13 [Sitodiplosis mosellana]|uniref:PDZ and LIM domain protein Zasp isoform X13 n=1 Tax=Sitodiplosis mosellana TaxID=263140 RepID=UPI002443DFA9|nr:PDZ and LIM domain protein Zasp isoform X13 [Sitodiplosis mosellana]
MAQLINIRLNRVDAQPWGLRLQGGKDFGTPLVVQKVSQGSISDQAGLQPGDAVIAVNNVEAFNLRHKDAQDLIVRSGNTFELTIQRGGSTWKPHVTPTGSLPSPGQQHHYGVGPVTKTSLQHHPPPNEQHIGCGYNNSARPFNQNGSVGGGSGNVKSIVNKQYNTPVGMYSEESIAETLTAQAEVLANGVLGVNFKKNEKAYNSEGSEVLKALKESENDPREPVSSHFYWTASHAIGNYSAISSRTNTPNPYSGQQQQQQVQQQLSQQISRNEDFAASESVQRSILPSTTTDSTKTPIVQTKIVDSSSQCIAASADASQQQLTTTSSKASPPCGDCGATIVGVFVRIKDKNLHVDCFKCATCGTSLKNQGYFNINNKLYCDVHAKLAAVQSAPTGTEGYRPGLIQPNSKLTANSTISNALSSHVNGGVKSNFGGPRPFGVPTAGPRSPAMHQQSWSQPKPAPTFANNYGSHTLPRSTVGQNAPGSSNKNFSQNIGAATSTPKRGRGVLNASVAPGGRIPKCGCCQAQIRGPFITALGRIWCPDHFVCVNGTCRRPLQDIGFVEEKGDLYCEYCFEQFLAPPCDKCNGKIKGDCLNAIGKHFHPECFNCTYCGKLFGNSPFFLEDGRPYCEADWNELFTTKCFACGFPVEAGDRWVEALSHNYHSQCFNCTMCKKNLEGQSFYAKAGRPYCKNHAR